MRYTAKKIKVCGKYKNYLSNFSSYSRVLFKIINLEKMSQPQQ